MLYNRNRILIDTEGRPVTPEALLAVVPDAIDPEDTFEAGPYRCAPVPDDTAARWEDSLTETAANWRWIPLRSAWNIMDHDSWLHAAKGAELISWNARTRYCPLCGAPMRRVSAISKRCTGCDDEVWPQLTPAVVVLVTRGDEALLVHASNFNSGMHALVAGFVETGETLEQCVIREVLEETSLHITDLKYVGSQSWPFPAQLMIGFTARYAGGELKWADGELSCGGFFTRDRLPMLPTPPSLSRAIIDMWVRGETELGTTLF